MKITSVVAMNDKRVIGINNQLPWHLPADLRYFKETTSGHHILMGRKCYDSIGRPLPNRTNIIVTRNKSLYLAHCNIVPTIEDGILMARNNFENELFIVGGAEIYKQSIEYWTDLLITWVDADVEGDVFFPSLNMNEWILKDEQKFKKDNKNLYDYTFSKYTRKT
ncbi:MAG: dihydrofolate reductase [Saprospiraceae bacterium]|nr:dihydrofolate reductase [Saprospiraceae bacterium]